MKAATGTQSSQYSLAAFGTLASHELFDTNLILVGLETPAKIPTNFLLLGNWSLLQKLNLASVSHR